MNEKVLGQLREAVSTAGTHTWPDVEAEIAAGSMQLWETDTAAIVTQLQVYPQGKAVCFFLAAGDLRQLQRMMPPLEEWGRQQGCTGAFMIGRAGWARSFLTKDMDWRQTAIVLEKKL